MRCAGALAVLALSSVGCGRSHPAAGGQPAPGDAGSLGNQTPSDQPVCPEPTTFVYVVSSAAQLYRFEPDKLQFTLVGRIVCPTEAQPFSMAVDRKGTAWVSYDDGSLFAVSTADASCQPTGFEPGQLGFSAFGMGFVADGLASPDTLYVAGTVAVGQTSTLNLAILELQSEQLVAVGTVPDPLGRRKADLTGNDQGGLFGLFVSADGAALAGVDRGTAAAGAPFDLSTLAGPTDSWAFSYWGGDFWFYTGERQTGTSHVTRYRTSTDNSVSVVVPDVGFLIVGAGISTCAPNTSVQ